MVYGLLFDVAAETLLRIAADPKHVGASIGATLVLHTWGSAITHYPHVHGIVPGGVLAPDGKCWIACRPGFFLPVRVLSRLFRRRVLEELLPVHQAGKLQFFGEHTALADARPFEAWLAPLRKVEWVVYAKRLLARAARSGFGADVRRMLLDAAHVPIKHPTKMRMPKASKKGQFVITLATANGDPTVYPNASDGVDAPRPTERSDLERTQFRVSPTYRRRTFLSLNARCRK